MMSTRPLDLHFYCLLWEMNMIHTRNLEARFLFHLPVDLLNRCSGISADPSVFDLFSCYLTNVSLHSA